MNKKSKAKFKIGDLVYFVYHPSIGVSTGVILEIKNDDCSGLREYIINPSKRITGSSIIRFYEEWVYKTLGEATERLLVAKKEAIESLNIKIDRAVNTLVTIYGVDLEGEIVRIRKGLTKLGNQDE